MRTAGIVIGALVGLLGLVWLGQGMGFIKGSFMTGSGFWAGIGAVLVAASVAVLIWALRRPRPDQP
jgi:apolipoprotein N-acyltransferase